MARSAAAAAAATMVRLDDVAPLFEMPEKKQEY